MIQSVTILLVEDNPGDVRLTREALRERKIQNELFVVHDGVEALDYLYQRGPYADATRPDLILLDLNLPKKSGHEVLVEIKQDPQLRTIPVVILTTSDSTEDIEQSYRYFANCYITKPIDLEQFVKVVQTIDAFWFSIVKLPETK